MVYSVRMWCTRVGKRNSMEEVIPVLLRATLCHLCGSGRSRPPFADISPPRLLVTSNHVPPDMIECLPYETVSGVVLNPLSDSQTHREV